MSNNTINSLIKDLSEPVIVDTKDSASDILAKIRARVNGGIDQYAKQNDLTDKSATERLDEVVSLFVDDLSEDIDEDVYEELQINLRMQTGTRFEADPMPMSDVLIEVAESTIENLDGLTPLPPWRDVMSELLDCYLSKDVYEGGYAMEYTNATELEYYPYWEIPMDAEVTLRFLPDKNEDNPMGFVKEFKTHSIPVKDGFHIDRRVTIPCLSDSGEQCMVCDEAREQYKDQSTHMVGSRLWPMKNYIANVLIVDDPLGKYNGHVCLLKFNKGIFDVIKDQLISGDIQNVPSDYIDGHNFIIKKRQHGQYTTYNATTENESGF